MDQSAKSLMYEMKRIKLKNKKMYVAKGKEFAVIVNRTKIKGNYRNAIYDVIQQGTKYYVIGNSKKYSQRIRKKMWIVMW